MLRDKGKEMKSGDNLKPEIEGFLNQAVRRGLATPLDKLMEGYRLTAKSEGKSIHTIAIVAAAVRYLGEFLANAGYSADVREIGASELRHFVSFLQEQPRFAQHRFTRPQAERLSGHTINGYMRALQAFWAWLDREGFILENPFIRIKIPKAPKKVIPTFTEEQLRQLFAVVDVASDTGYRDYAIMLTLLDTGLRCSELNGLTLQAVNLDSRLLKVWGKGSKERLVPIGAKVQKALWKYTTCHRPEPAMPRYDHVFLTRDGRPLTKNRLESIVGHYGKKAGITGVRLSPHTLRHTMAVTFLRNGGDVFSLQRILGHSQLEVLRGYINLALSDISRVHLRNSPADNLELPTRRVGGRNLPKTGKAGKED
ncbi:MAG TPA: tyrosine-type recombinase/integrase [Dehalococcoidia bacterium]|nr:tyrosine-type recombinase/integrase [Dehalococcoidia bacterium]